MKIFIKLFFKMFQNEDKDFVCCIMGRKSYELHARPKIGFFNDLELKGHKLIKIVISNCWDTIPSNIFTENSYVVKSWKEVRMIKYVLQY